MTPTVFRIRLIFNYMRPQFRFLDSVNAAVVAGLTEAGVPSEKVTGREAGPWTFAVGGFSKRGGMTVMSGLTISTADAEIARALAGLDPAATRARSSNGDELDFAGADVSAELRLPHEEISELAVAFGSPFAVMKPKTGRSKTRFHDDLGSVDLSAALRASVSARAGREVDLEFHVDPLTLAVNGRRRLVSTRFVRNRRILIPAFSMPLTMRGRPEDIRFAYFAGIGAKTRGGFGCPVMLQ